MIRFLLCIIVGFVIGEIIQTRPTCHQWNVQLAACEAQDVGCVPRVRAERPTACREVP